MDPVCKNSIKIGDILKLSKKLQDYLLSSDSNDDFIKTTVEEIDIYLHNLGSALQFYANKNYDNGLVARMCLGQMTIQDENQYAVHADNTHTLDCEYDKF